MARVVRAIGPHIHTCKHCGTIALCLNNEAVCGSPDETECPTCWIPRMVTFEFVGDYVIRDQFRKPTGV